MDKSREDLLQNVVQHMMSVRRLVRHPLPPPGEPPLSPPQANLLFAISHKPQGTSVKVLAEVAGVTPGAITQFVDALVEKGLVVRESDPSDRRVVKLKLTELANTHFEKFRRIHVDSFAKVFEVLTDDDLKQLIGLLEKIESSHDYKDKIDV